MPRRQSSTTREVLFRPAEPGDLNYILKTWIRDFRKSPFAGPYTAKRLVVALKATIADILSRATVTVACSAPSPRVIFGFAVFERGEPTVLHYVYVKDGFREHKIGGTLVEIAHGRAQDLRYTFKTTHKHFKALMRAHGGRFAPGLCRNPNRNKGKHEKASSTVELGSGGTPETRA